jgi:hypothetical protein
MAYGPTAATAGHALQVVVEHRIAELLRFRRWYRAQPNWGYWLDLAAANDLELRALVRLARRARRIAATAYELPESADPVTAAKGYREGYTDAGYTESEARMLWGWTESEKRFAAGDR